MILPSVGPFELTETEFIGLELLRQDDERQIRKTALRATWSGRELRVRAEDTTTVILYSRTEVVSRALPY
jgi:hypothetical protein